ISPMALACVYLALFSELTMSGLQSGTQTNDLDKLQGKWQVIDVKSSDPVDHLGKGMIIEFKGKTLINTKGEVEWSRFTVEINPKAKRKEIDLTRKKGQQCTKCIYELADNALKIRYPCFPTLERPTSLDPNVNPAQPLLVLKRLE